MKVHGKEVATLRQYIALSINRLSYGNLERHIISEGVKLGIQFGRLYYDGSTDIYDFDRALTELSETKECPIIYENGTSAIEILEENSIFISGFDQEALTNRFIDQSSSAYLVRFDLYIPLLFKLINDYPIHSFSMVTRHLLLAQEIGEDECDDFVVARLWHGHSLSVLINTIMQNSRNHGYKCFNNLELREPVNIEKIMVQKFDSNVGYHFSYSIEIDQYSIHLVLKQSCLIFLYPVGPIKMKKYGSQVLVDIEFYISIIVTIFHGLSLCEVYFDPKNSPTKK
jgi:hypothetical protein